MSTDIKTVELTLPIACRHLGNEKKAIEQRLIGMISHYVAQADGILIKWSDLIIFNDKGIIIDDQPYIFYRISFTAQVFKPVEGKSVKAKVHRLQKSYFIAKALNAFTVTVSIPDNLLDHDIIKALSIDQEIYFKFRGTSDGTYRGEIDDECLDLISGLIQQQLEMAVDDDAYAYAKDFEY